MLGDREVGGDVGLKVDVQFEAELGDSFLVFPGLNGAEAGIGAMVQAEPGMIGDNLLEVGDLQVSLSGFADVDDGPGARGEALSEARDQRGAKGLGDFLGDLVSVNQDDPIVDIFQGVRDGDIEPVGLGLGVEKPDGMAGGGEEFSADTIAALREVTTLTAPENRQ